MDRQDEAARDAEASGDPAHFNEQAARDRLSSMMRQGDPASREDIVKRLAELDAQDAADDDGLLENSRDYKRDSNGRFASTGSNIHKQKGGRTTKGNPKAKTQQSNIPSKLPPNASDGQLERQIAKGLDAVDAHKGNQTVSRGKEKYTFTQKRSDHRSKHRSEGVDNGKIAKALTQGKFEKDGKRSVAYKGDTKIIKVSKKGSADITTSYKEDRFRTHTKKKPGQEPSSTGR